MFSSQCYLREISWSWLARLLSWKILLLPPSLPISLYWRVGRVGSEILFHTPSVIEKNCLISATWLEPNFTDFDGHLRISLLQDLAKDIFFSTSILVYLAIVQKYIKPATLKFSVARSYSNVYNRDELFTFELTQHKSLKPTCRMTWDHHYLAQRWLRNSLNLFHIQSLLYEGRTQRKKFPITGLPSLLLPLSEYRIYIEFQSVWS